MNMYNCKSLGLAPPPPFNVKVSVVIAREQIVLCSLTDWELESVDREPNV